MMETNENLFKTIISFMEVINTHNASFPGLKMNLTKTSKIDKMETITNSTDSKSKSKRDLDSKKHSSNQLTLALPFLEPLMNYIKCENENANLQSQSNQVLSRTDIAGILLPFAVNYFLYILKQEKNHNDEDKKQNKKETDLKTSDHGQHQIIWEAFSYSIQLLMFNDLNDDNDHILSLWNEKHSYGEEINKTNIENNVSNNYNSSKIIESCLTQSVLNKLIPYAAKVAFSKITPTTNVKKNKKYPITQELQMISAQAAGVAFLCMNRLFRPTMDVACKLINDNMELALSASIVSFSSSTTNYFQGCNINHEADFTLDELHSTNNISISLPYSFQKDILHSSLMLYLRLSKQNAANPKKIFMLVTKKLLPTLSKMLCMEVLQDQTLEKSNKELTHSKSYSIYDLVREILWEGLFHPQYHIEGFISACFLETEINELQQNEINIDKEDENMNLKKPSKKKKNKLSKENQKDASRQRSCYQQILFETIQEHVNHFYDTIVKNKEGATNNTSSSQMKALVSDDTFAVVNIVPLLFQGFIKNTQLWKKDDQYQYGQNTNITDNGNIDENDIKSGQKRKFNSSMDNSAHTMTILRTQFRFWSTIMKCMFDQLSSSDASTNINPNKQNLFSIFLFHEIEGCLLRTISSTLKLLLHHIIYLPAYEDNGNIHFQTLQTFANQILERTEKYNTHTKETKIQKHHQEISKDIHDAEIMIARINIMRLRQDELKICQSLLNLNHHLFHEKLSRLIKVASKYLSDEQSFGNHLQNHKTSFRESSNLICLIIDIYGKLRQIKHLFSSFLTSLHVDSKVNDFFMDQVFNDAAILEAFSKVIQKCPPGQTQDLWKVFENEIRDSYTNYIDNNTPENETKDQDHYLESKIIQWASEIFVLFMRSIHIEKQNAANIRTLCAETKDSLVAELLKPYSAMNQFDLTNGSLKNSLGIKVGLFICGWLIDLQTRCYFWLEPMGLKDVWETSLIANKEAGVLPLVNKASEEFIEKSQNNSNTPSSMTFVIDQFQHLSCQRLQELHSMVHSEELIEAYNDKNNLSTKSQKIISEASRLVDLAFFATKGRKNQSFHDENKNEFALSNTITTHSPWKKLAETVSTWVSYCKPDHTISFLQWVFSILATTPNELNKDNNVMLFPDLGTIVNKNIFEMEKELIFSLIQDASFFESHQVAEYYVKVCLSSIVRLIQIFFDNGFNENKNIDPKCSKNSNISDILISPLHDDWKKLSLQELSKLSEKNTIYFCDSISETISLSGYTMERSCLLNRAMRLLLVLNETSRELFSISDKIAAMDTSLRVDASIYAFLLETNKLSNEEKKICIKIMCTCRSLVASSFADQLERQENLFLHNSESIAHILKYVMNSMITLQELQDGNNESFDANLLISKTAVIIQEIFALCTSPLVDNIDLLTIFFDSMFEIISKLTEATNLNSFLGHAYLAILRSPIRCMVLLNESEHHTITKRSGSDGLNAKAKTFKLIRLTLTLLLPFSARMLNTVQRTSDDEKNLYCNAVLLLSDSLHFWSHCQSSKSLERSIELEESIKNHIDIIFCAVTDTVMKGSINSSKNECEASLYFLFSICSRATEFRAFINPLHFFIRITETTLVYFILNKGKFTSILDSAFCRLIYQGNDAEIDEIMKYLEIKCNGAIGVENIASVIHVFHLLCVSIKGQSRRDMIAKSARKFLCLTYEIFQCSDLNNNDVWIITAGNHFLNFVVEKKEILQLRTCDIATILSQLNSSLERFGSLFNEQNILFNDFNLILMNLLKHYSKNIYACVPNFISALHCLLLNILSSSSSSASNAVIISEKAKEFTKLCDALAVHKDIFKKHVVGLLLHFCDALSSGMNSSTKKVITPAVFSLLDICSSFEIDQLNASMSITSKALFRMVYKNYQRTHRYKGHF